MGPELIAAAWLTRERDALPPFAVAGGARLLAAAAKLRGMTLPIEQVETLEDARDVFGRSLPVLGALDGAYCPGHPDEDGAEPVLPAP